MNNFERMVNISRALGKVPTSVGESNGSMSYVRDDIKNKEKVEEVLLEIESLDMLAENYCSILKEKTKLIEELIVYTQEDIDTLTSSIDNETLREFIGNYSKSSDDHDTLYKSIEWLMGNYDREFDVVELTFLKQEHRDMLNDYNKFKNY